MSRWWLQDCRSDAYVPEEEGAEEEQATAAIKSAQAPAFHASPQVTESSEYGTFPRLTVPQVSWFHRDQSSILIKDRGDS